jgi:Holliday junction resolvase
MVKVKRVDKNQAEIVENLRANGFAVALMHTAGEGFPDLVVSKKGLGTFLVEVKHGKGKLNDRQIKFHNNWIDSGGEDIIVIYNAEQFYVWLSKHICQNAISSSKS